MGPVVEMQALDMDIGYALGAGVSFDRISLDIDRDINVGHEIIFVVIDVWGSFVGSGRM